MIRHIVLFKLTEFENDALKTTKLKEIKSGLESLPQKISEIKFLQVGINANPAEKYDIALTTDFNSLEELDIYAKHPEHIKVAQIIRAVLAERACVDFQI